MTHTCCPHPAVRVEDSDGGRVLPSRGQCGCSCHEKRVDRSVVTALLDDAYENGRAQTHDDLVAALTKIADSPEGAYRRDALEYAHNVIEWCRETASAAIAAARGAEVPA